MTFANSPIPIYEADGVTLEAQYETVGRLFRTEIQRAAKYVLSERSRWRGLRHKAAKKALLHLKALATSESTYAGYYRSFLACQAVWAKGAGISVSRAMILTADTLAGCQTVLYRGPNGSVAMFHSEEDYLDMKHHMSKAHTVKFSEGGEEFFTLVYNNLLPGCGLCSWSRGAVVACDSLYLRTDFEDVPEQAALVNVASWIVWRMGNEASEARVRALLAEMGTFVDGYAMQIARRSGSSVDAYKLLFTRNEVATEALSAVSGAVLVQSNIVDNAFAEEHPNFARWRTRPEAIAGMVCSFFLPRLVKMDKHLPVIGKILSEQDVEKLHTELQTYLMQTRELGFANKMVGAVAVAVLTPDENTMSVHLNRYEYPSPPLEFYQTLI